VTARLRLCWHASSRAVRARLIEAEADGWIKKAGITI
jgi:hypothetical protein